MKKARDLIVIFVIAMAAPFAAGYLTNLFGPWIGLADPEGLFLWRAIHHIFQGLLGIVILKLYFRKPLREMGFSLDNKALSLRIFKWFVIVWTPIILLFFLCGALFVPGFGGYITGLYPPRWEAVAATLGFDLLMLSAIGEEPIFRPFVGLGLQTRWGKTIRVGRVEVSYAAVLSGVIFMLAHVHFDLMPFRIIHVDPIKLLLNIVLGIFWAAVFERTRSLLCTLLAHTYSNLLIYVCGFVTAYLLG